MSDHFSGPAVMGDPTVDITDFYAFPSPERPGNLVLIMNVFPMATPQSFFSDVLTHRFRLRPLTRSDGSLTYGTAEHTIDVTFSDVPEGSSAQRAKIVTSDGREASVLVGKLLEQGGMRVFAGLVSDPFFMDVEAALRTDFSGKLSFSTAVNTVQFRDVLSIVVEVPFAPIVERFDGNTLVGAIAETLVTRRGKPIRLERLGRPEIKNVVMANPMRDPRTTGVELRDLYNREDAFALSPVYRPLYEARLDANLAFFDGLDGKTAWPIGADGRHPLRDLLIDDYLMFDLSRPFAPGGFLEIERALIDKRPHTTAGGRWLDDDILDELLTWMVNGGRGERLGDGVDRPTKPAGQSFPYVREPNNRTDLPLPAFLRS
jgi:Domain of unknown function (DUF4331)